MFPANGAYLNGSVPKVFSDDTHILGYDPVIMPALIQAELPLVNDSKPNAVVNCVVKRG
jgi:hypothetical protein